MTFLILTYIFVMADKKLNFYAEKKGYHFCQKYKIQIFVKNSTFFSVFRVGSSALARKMLHTKLQ